MDYKLELIQVPVSDIDRAKSFFTASLSCAQVEEIVTAANVIRNMVCSFFIMLRLILLPLHSDNSPV